MEAEFGTHNYETLMRIDSLASYISRDEERFRILINSIADACENVGRFDPNPEVHFPRIYGENASIDDVREFIIIMSSKKDGKTFLDRTINFFVVRRKTDMNYKEGIYMNETIRKKEMFLKLIYFFVFYSNTNIEKVYSSANVIGWKVDTFYDKKRDFSRIPGEEKILYHGTAPNCIYSILRNSLKNCSGTDLMTSGAVYGNGIYLSGQVGFSNGYAVCGGNGRWRYILVVKTKNLNEKTTGNLIYVQQPEDILICGMISVLGNSFAKLEPAIDAIIAGSSFEEIVEVAPVEELKTCDFLQINSYSGEYRNDPKVVNSRRFRIDVEKIISNPPQEYISRANFQIENDPGSPLLVELIPAAGSDLAKDCLKYKIPGIIVALYFPKINIGNQVSAYPLIPPIVRVIYPKFKMSTGRISRGGSICVDMLYAIDWKPITSIESLLVILIDVISNESQETSTGKPGGRIDNTKLEEQYSFAEFVECYSNTGNVHKWSVML